MNSVQKCPVCGGTNFTYNEVLWDELISDWELSPLEVDYINRQQGYICDHCGNNLRSMALAYGILKAYDFSGLLEGFVESDAGEKIKVLEINEAGGLNPVLQKLPHHQLACYPEFNLLHLPFADSVFDLVLHSDSLEHVSDPIRGLSECRRVLREHGLCIFTIPLIIGRLTRSRAGLKNSYHGFPDQKYSDYIVHTEFGADMWKYAFEAGFSSVRLHSFNYPSAIVIEGIK
jgi:SAM-dependent methyltransferase